MECTLTEALPTPLASQDRSENEVEKLKSTLILCYGHVAAQAPRELVLAKVESDILRNIFQYFSTKVGARHAACAGVLEGAATRVACVNSCHFCCSGSGNKGRDQGTVCRS